MGKPFFSVVIGKGGWDNLSEQNKGSSTDTAPSFSELDAASVLIDLTSGGSGEVLTEKEGEGETRGGEEEEVAQGEGEVLKGIGNRTIKI